MADDGAVSAGLLSSMAASSGPRALLLRHSDRHAFPEGKSGDATRLTHVGEQRARALGQALGESITWSLSSPLVRCTRTAELMGANPVTSQLLGDPGPFVIDRDIAAQVFMRQGTREVVFGQIRGETWGCMRPLDQGAGLLLDLLQTNVAANPGIGIAISHDAIVMPFITQTTGYDFVDDWLEPLICVFISLSDH